MPNLVQSSIHTLGEVFSMMSPFAGGSIPDADDAEYLDWTRWVQQAQEEYARRGFWRRLLAREEVTLTTGTTSLLPVRFHKPNGLYMCIIDEVDWMNADNSDEQHVFVEMINDSTDLNFGRWRMRFDTDVAAGTAAILWYFANPPAPTATSDKLLLPGDMCGYRALVEYYRTSGAEGSQDQAAADAEDRFQEYLALEVIPGPHELHVFSRSNVPRNYTNSARDQYRSRTGRSTQR